jgi:hypothetical protein
MRCFPLCDQLPIPEPPGTVTMDEYNSDADEFIQTRWENSVIVIQHLNKVVHSQNLISYLKQILITSFGVEILKGRPKF